MFAHEDFKCVGLPELPLRRVGKGYGAAIVLRSVLTYVTSPCKCGMDGPLRL